MKKESEPRDFAEGSLTELRERIYIPIITDNFAERVRKVAVDLEDSLAISQLYLKRYLSKDGSVISEPVPDKLKVWVNFYFKLEDREKAELSSCLGALIRSRKFETVGELRAKTIEDIMALKIRRIGLLKAGFIKAIFR